MIQFTHVSLQLGTRFLFQDLNFTLHAHEKVGLIGQNGVGKSTLFAMIQGDIQPDQGDIQLPKNLRLATVKQETPALAMSALDYVLDGDPVYRQQQSELRAAEQTEDIDALGKIHEWMLHTEHYAKPAKAATLLHGLGFRFEDQEKNVAEFSGGWRMRLNLAQALIADSDVLLLDEPTNHLDLEAVLWLEEWLKDYPGILLIISHDREFLDKVVKAIFWLHHEEIKRFTGHYSDFETQRATQLEQQQASFVKHQREREHLQHFINRFKAQATKATQAQSRIKALERMGEMLPAYEESVFQFSFPECVQNVKGVLLSLQHASIGYENHAILKDAEFNLSNGQRIGLLGPNGAGKSTLIKALAGERTLLAGTRAVNPHLSLGYFSQHQLDILREDESPLWHIRHLSPHTPEPDIRKFLGQFDFKGNTIFDPIRHFSGGEKARLALALIVFQKPNVLLLDEPTNHLDIEMRQALILALQDYEGAVVIISHDRHLLRTTTDELFLVYQGKLTQFKGTIDDYPAWWKKEQKKDDERTRQTPSPKTDSTSNCKGNRKKATLEHEAHQVRIKHCQQLEKELAGLHLKLALLEDSLSEDTLYHAENKNKLTEIIAEQVDLKSTIQSLETEWLQAMALLEEAGE